MERRWHRAGGTEEVKKVRHSVYKMTCLYKSVILWNRFTMGI